MRNLIVHGGKSLCGTVRIGGSKNAALPLLFATLVSRGVSVFHEVPAIADVKAALSILCAYGAKIERPSPGTVTVDTRRLSDCDPPDEEVKKIRASSYLLGACLSRFGRVRLLPFGGCAFCRRPIDMHLSCAAAFGAERRGEELLVPKGLRGAFVTFAKTSVGATVNALLLAVCAEGESEIRGAALEPHVLALVGYLSAAGADIRRSGDTFFIRNNGTLHGAEVTVIPDMIEAGTYLLAGLMTDGEVTVENACPDDLAPFLSCLSEAGAVFSIGDGRVTVFPSEIRPFSVTASPFPGFPTDLQPQTAALMAKNRGGVIRDLVFPERFGYLDCLAGFGVRYERKDGSALLYPASFTAAQTEAADLRGGAAACLTALPINGTSVIKNAEILLRGYEDLSIKLSALGADVEIK